MMRLAVSFAILALGLSCGPSTAMAQARAASTPGAQPQLGPTDFLNAALQVVASVDRYEMAAIWDSSSRIMQARIPKERFISSTAQNRAKLGSIGARDWTAIMRVIIVDERGPLPPGRYMSVRFKTTGKSGMSMEEVVSFHLANDGQWKLAGYSIN